jgi:hypothetical protein
MSDGFARRLMANGIGLQPIATITIYTPELTAKSLHAILLFSVYDALTSCRCADKNAHFLRQAVNFASRNGRLQIR